MGSFPETYNDFQETEKTISFDSQGFISKFLDVPVTSHFKCALYH